MAGIASLRRLLVIGMVAACCWTPSAMGQTPPATEISERTAIVDLLKERLRKQPANLRRTFSSIAVTDLFFPGDVAPFKNDTRFDRINQYPRDVQRVEQWYLAQIPELYEEAPRPHDSQLRVLYLPRCREVQPPNADTFFPDEAADGNAITASDMQQAYIELALEQEGVSLQDIGRDRIAEASAAGATARQLRALNIRLLADNDAASTKPLMVLKGYCGSPTAAAEFPGVFFPPEPYPPPPAPPVEAGPRYYLVKMPPGIASVKIGSGFQALVCQARKIPLHDSRCLWETAKDNMPIRFNAPGRHVFTGKQGATWRRGSFRLSADQTYDQPPPPPPGGNYASMGMAAIELIPDP